MLILKLKAMVVLRVLVVIQLQVKCPAWFRMGSDVATTWVHGALCFQTALPSPRNKKQNPNFEFGESKIWHLSFLRHGAAYHAAPLAAPCGIPTGKWICRKIYRILTHRLGGSPSTLTPHSNDAFFFLQTKFFFISESSRWRHRAPRYLCWVFLNQLS